MKKTINGKKFDTNNAIKVGSGDNLHCVSSIDGWDYWEAELFVTRRSGAYFLAGSGGPGSRFSQSCGRNAWAAGSDLIPLPRTSAIEWALEHLHPDVVAKHFGIEYALPKM